MFINIKESDITSSNSGNFLINIDNIAGINEYDGNIIITFKQAILQKEDSAEVLSLEVSKNIADFTAHFRGLKLNT
jgi:hypothetical protein